MSAEAPTIVAVDLPVPRSPRRNVKRWLVHELVIPREQDSSAPAARRAFPRHAERTRAHAHLPAIAEDDISGRLIAAQEAERARIARQLHDDLSQRLAVLSMGLSSLRAHLPAGKQACLTALQQQVIDLSKEIRRLSHELHPEVLRHVGLISALRQHCRELTDQGKLRVTFHAPDGLPAPEGDVAFCVYRVAQEALRNSIRHAGPCEAHVMLEASGDRRLRLSVTDNGKGFEVAFARRGGGLGLASMEERVRAVDGELVLSSHVGRGTEVTVEAPLKGVGHASPESRPRG